MKQHSVWLLPVRIIGSMYFAVALILILAAVMAWATFLGMQFGDDTSSWAVYHATWFLTLCGLLGLSVLFSALLRFPWKKYQLGFLVTHLGILVLLAGCWLDFERGRSAYLSIAEGGTNSVAVCPKETHFDLHITRNGKTGQKITRKTIPFTPGPFSWRFYGEKPFAGWGAGESLPRFPWNFLPRHRAGDVLYRDADCELTVLDFLQAAQPGNMSESARMTEPGKMTESGNVSEPSAAPDFRWEVVNAGGNVSGNDAARGAKQRMASWKPWVKLCLTADGETVEFWLCEFDFFLPGGYECDTPSVADQTVFRVRTQKGTDISLIFAQNTVDLNFAVRLDRFNYRLDPGTSMASHYSSDVTLLEKNVIEKTFEDPSEKSVPEKVIASDLNVLMNQPVDIYEPRTHQVWRLFQTSYNGPYMNPAADGTGRGQYYISSFTLHYSPGRGLLYLGCLFIVLGIGMMYSMKAYFFQKLQK